MVGEKIVNGEWDGQPIWRHKTAGEELADEISKAHRHTRLCTCGNTMGSFREETATLEQARLREDYQTNVQGL